MKKRIILLLLAAAALTTAAARPRLIVQIVVGSMRAGDLERYAANFGDGGLKRLTEGGTHYTDARYDCMQTTTPVSLTTLATGAMPSMHGVIGPTWRDYTSNETVFLTEGKRGPGAYHLIAPTLAETLRAQYPESRTVTVAAETESAILLAGKGGNVFWLETGRCNWATSPYYAEELPDWIARSNREHYNLSFLAEEWRTLLDRARYRNTRHWDITLAARNRREKDEAGKGRLHPADDLERLRCTPAGNSALLAFAKQAIAQYRLGTDEVPDLLTVCLDPARRIMETYGPESVEVEDMYYRLDRDLADFLTYLFAQVRDGDAVVVLTSDHGSSPSFDAGPAPAERFNARQFEVIVNGFLNVRYGMGNWVLGYEERSLWLNHNLIYERARVALHILAQLGVALAGVMEIRNGIIQAARVEIREHHLEAAECLARAAHHAQIVAGIVGYGGHVVAQPPEAVLVKQIVAPVPRVMKVQILHAGMLLADVPRHPVDVLHQFHRPLKGVGVDPLHQIGFDLRHAGAVVADVVDLIRVVDIAHLDLLVGEKRAGNPKRLANLQQLARGLRIHRLLTHRKINSSRMTNSFLL